MDKNKLVEEYINFINMKPQEIKKKFKLNISKSDYIDDYMRIDLMLPEKDYVTNKRDIFYDRVSLLEIEPFASGKGYVYSIRNAVDIKKENDIPPKSAQETVFTNIIQQKIQNNENFDWININDLLLYKNNKKMYEKLKNQT